LDGYKGEKWPTGCYGPAKIKKECEMADGMERSQAMWAVCVEAGRVSQHHTKKFMACLRNNDTDGMGFVLAAVARGLKDFSKKAPVDEIDGVADEEDDDSSEGSSEVEELTERQRKRNEVRRRAHDAEEREERQQQSRLEEGAKRRKKVQEEEERRDKEHRERLEESKRQRQRSIEEWHRAEEQMRAASAEKTGGGETEAEAVRVARAAAEQLAKNGEGLGLGQHQQQELAAAQARITQVIPGDGGGEHLGATRFGAHCGNPLAHDTGTQVNATYSPFTGGGMPHAHAMGNPFPAPPTLLYPTPHLQPVLPVPAPPALVGGGAHYSMQALPPPPWWAYGGMHPHPLALAATPAPPAMDLHHHVRVASAVFSIFIL